MTQNNMTYQQCQILQQLLPKQNVESFEGSSVFWCLGCSKILMVLVILYAVKWAIEGSAGNFFMENIVAGLIFTLKPLIRQTELLLHDWESGYPIYTVIYWLEQKLQKGSSTPILKTAELERARFLSLGCVIWPVSSNSMHGWVMIFVAL